MRLGSTLADENDFLVGQRVGRIPHRRVNVLTDEARMRILQIASEATR